MGAGLALENLNWALNNAFDVDPSELTVRVLGIRLAQAP